MVQFDHTVGFFMRGWYNSIRQAVAEVDMRFILRRWCNVGLVVGVISIAWASLGHLSTGRKPMEDAPVDHKDTPGGYRQQVRANVLGRVGAQSSAVTSREKLVGDWLVSFVGFQGQEPKQALVYRLTSDGKAAVEMTGQPPSKEDEWRLNDDGSFSMLVWVAAMPEYGLPDPTHEEQRMHLAALPDGRLVLWNGDGSLVKLLSPLQKDGRAAAE
jgi:hypothetical protein